MQHHYLPQFYLKGFGAKAPPRNHVWIHRPNRGWQRQAIKVTAVEAGYYVLTDDTGAETDEFEQLLSRIENDATHLIREKIPGQQPLTDSDRQNLAVFIATMQARVPAQRDHAGDFTARIGEKVLAVLAHAMKEEPRRWETLKRRFESETGERIPDSMTPDDLDPRKYEMKANPQVSLALSFSALEVVSSLLLAKGWRFLITSAPAFFITSDYPVGVWDPTTDGTFYGPALAAPETEVSFPLTKTAALLAGGKMTGIRWVIARQELVAQINARTMMRASFLVSATSSALGLKV